MGAASGVEVVGDWSAHSGYAAGRQIAVDPEVTAVFAASDAMALGVLRAFNEYDRAVPSEVSVVGFGNLPDSAYFSPPLTTVEQPLDLLGDRIVDLLVRVLSGVETPTPGLPEARLVVRSSTAGRNGRR